MNILNAIRAFLPKRKPKSQWEALERQCLESCGCVCLCQRCDRPLNGPDALLTDLGSSVYAYCCPCGSISIFDFGMAPVPIRVDVRLLPHTQQVAVNNFLYVEEVKARREAAEVARRRQQLLHCGVQMPAHSAYKPKPDGPCFGVQSGPSNP